MFPVFEIKALLELTWEDIPFIELPTFGHEHALAALFGRHDFFGARVLNIDAFKNREVPHFHPDSNYHVIERQLHYLFYHGHYFSVARHGIPFGASFTWRALETHPDGGEWNIHHRVYGDPLKQKLEDLAKRLGAQKRRMMAEQAAEASPAALIPVVKRVVEKSVVKKPASQPAPQSKSPQNLDECANRLELARERLCDQGYQAKYTDEQQLVKVKNNEVSKERFLVSFQTENTKPGAKLAYQRNSKLVPIWATSFDQLENADTDPELIAKILGTPYYPEKDYVLHIIDRGETLNQFGQNTLIPTWDNMQEPTQKYLGGKHDPAVLSEVMTPGYQKQYAKSIEEYHVIGLDEFDLGDQKDYLESLSVQDKEKFSARHNVRTEIGANSEFTGNGLTQSREGSTHYGVVETLTLENDPPPISKMNNVKTVELKPIRMV